MCFCLGVGTTVDEIIEGLAAVTAEKVFGKFFSFGPKCNTGLGQWLDSWIKIGKGFRVIECQMLMILCCYVKEPLHSTK